MVDKRPGPTWPDAFSEDGDSGAVHRRPATYGKVFAPIIHDLALTDGAVRLYAHMHWRYGSNHQMFESHETMAEAMGVSQRAIKTRINELAAQGWIVVIARRTEGKFTSNFYHIFEHSDDAAAFRKDYKPAEGEFIIAAPIPEKRRSRKGIGGKSTHKTPDTVGTQVHKAVGTQVPMDTVGTQVPTAVGTQVPTIYTHITQTQKRVAPAVADAAPLPELTPEQLFDLAANAYQSRPVSNDVAKVLAMPTNSKPDKPARANPHFDAIITAFHFDAATMTKTEKGGIGKVAAELNAAGYTPEDIAEIHAYCVRKGFDAFTPHALTAHASAWRASVNGKGAAKSGSMFGEGNWNLHAWDDIDAVGGAK